MLSLCFITIMLSCSHAAMRPCSHAAIDGCGTGVVVYDEGVLLQRAARLAYCCRERLPGRADGSCKALGDLALLARLLEEGALAVGLGELTMPGWISAMLS